MVQKRKQSGNGLSQDAPEMSDKQGVEEIRSPIQQFQSTPNSNNTTGIILGSRDNRAGQINNDSLGGNNKTYRSENAKNTDGTLVVNKNKIQKKLNTLLNQGQSLPIDD